MRQLMLVVVMALATGGVAAAQAPSPLALTPLGPISFGMSTEAVRAAVPGAEWDVIQDDALQRGSMRSRGAALSLYGVNFRAHLSYASDAVTFMRLTAELPLAEADCAARHRAIAEAEMRARTFSRREYWYRFREDPDGPSGSMDGDTFVPAPFHDERATFTPLSGSAEDFDANVIASFRDRAYGQAFHRAKDWQGDVSALSFSRAGAPVCQIVMQSANPRATGGARVSDGPEGAARLSERLAGAEFRRPLTYLANPDGSLTSRLYPERALEREIAGDVVMDCLVLADGLLDCRVNEETPADMEFGLAALRIVRGSRVDVFDGPSAGRRTQMTIRFRLPS